MTDAAIDDHSPITLASMRLHADLTAIPTPIMQAVRIVSSTAQELALAKGYKFDKVWKRDHEQRALRNLMMLLQSLQVR